MAAIDPYFAKAEGQIHRMWVQNVWPFIQDVDFTSTLDLAAGHGRNSALLLEHSKSLTIMDIQEGNVEVCRTRFRNHANISYVVNNGYDFSPVPASSLSFIYCFDAMVHFESDVVRSYLKDARRVLIPGGCGFFHHSNFTGADDWRTNPASRNFMSKELFSHYARKEGLKVLRQRVMNWSNHKDIDCFTMIMR